MIITANDGDGGIATVTFSLNVDNAPPVLTINNPNLVVAESDTGEATNTGTYSDALDDTSSDFYVEYKLSI